MRNFCLAGNLLRSFRILYEIGIDKENHLCYNKENFHPEIEVEAVEFRNLLMIAVVAAVIAVLIAAVVLVLILVLIVALILVLVAVLIVVLVLVLIVVLVHFQNLLFI